MCSNPKITQLAQLQSGPHYTALQNRGRNTRPIKTKRESGDARKNNIYTAGVDLTCLLGECPGGTVAQGTCRVLPCPGSVMGPNWHLFVRCSLCLSIGLPIFIQYKTSHTLKYCPKTFLSHSHVHFTLLDPRPLVWSGLSPCQRSLFTQDSSKSVTERAHCTGEV